MGNWIIEKLKSSHDLSDSEFYALISKTNPVEAAQIILRDVKDEKARRLVLHLLAEITTMRAGLQNIAETSEKTLNMPGEWWEQSLKDIRSTAEGLL